MGEIIERPVRGAAFHAEGEWAIPEGYEAEVKDGKIIVRKKASVDERIRRAIIMALNDTAIAAYGDITIGEMLAYLERQKEQKSDGWSEDDETALQYVHELIEFGYSNSFMDEQTAADMRDWVNKSTHPVKEWSEGDEKMIDKIVENLTELKNRYDNGYGRVGDCIAWLEARRPQAKQKQTSEEE